MSARIKVAMALAAINGVLAFGTLGYKLLMPWSWFESFYFSLITITTIGYGEPLDLTDEARFFNAILIILGVGTLGYGLSVLAQSIISSEIVDSIGKRRMIKDIARLENHYIVCGAGRVGRRVASAIVSHRSKCVMIEIDELKAEQYLEEGYRMLVGDATSEEVLKLAGIEQASGLVCALGSDAENLYTTMTAREMNADLLIVTRGIEESAVQRLTKGGADRVISPVVTGAHHMAHVLLKPAVADFIELATMAEKLELEIEQIQIAAESVLAGKTLRESKIHAQLNVMIIAIKRGEEPMRFNPTADTVMQAEDALMAMGSHHDLESLNELACPED